MGVLGNSFSVDLDEQNQRNEFHRAYMLFQQDIITEYAQFGFDIQGLHTFATLLWKKYKKFVDRCLGIETAFDLMNKKRDLVKKMLANDPYIKLFNKCLNEYASGELKFGAKINNLKSDQIDQEINIKIFNRSTTDVCVRKVSSWPLKKQDVKDKDMLEIAPKSDQKLTVRIGTQLILFEKDKWSKPLSAYKP